MTPSTVDRMLSERARATPERVAIEAAGRMWTYAELDARSDELAASLEPGSRVTLSWEPEQASVLGESRPIAAS